MERAAITIGSGSGARIIVTPLVREHVGATDYWDGNWISCDVTVAAGGFRGSYVACLRAEEFVAFRADLERLYRELKGVGGFHTMEGWVTIDLSGDGRGHFTGTGRLRDRAGDGNALECQLEFDQTDVPSMVEQLERIQAAFPVFGKPAG